MKRKFCVAVVCMCLSIGATAYAAVGDIADTLYNTDIITYLDGKQIKGYSLDGRMMICLEDLRNYGYAVEYDDSIRTLFVTKDGDISEDFNPYFERGTIGGIAGYTYETDIVAYVNGVYVDTENIGGRLVAVAEDLANVAEEDTTEISKKERNPSSDSSLLLFLRTLSLLFHSFCVRSAVTICA